MIGKHLVYPFHFTGTLAANVTITLTLPIDCVLKHISAVASNDSDATLIVGDSGDTDEVLASTTIGDSGVPVEKDRDDWASTNEAGRYRAGDVFVATLDYDGAAGTAAANVTLVFTFLEG